MSNFAYYRWSDVYPILRSKINEIQDELTAQLAITDSRALDLYQKKGADEAVRCYATLVSVNAGNALYTVWMDFYGELFVSFRDFYTIVPKKDEPVCGCEAKEPGLSTNMKRRINEDTGSHCEVANDSHDTTVTLNGENYVEAAISRLSAS